MGYDIQQGSTTRPLRFLMVLDTDHRTGAPGLTPTVTIAKGTSSSFAAAAGSVTDIGSGWYQVEANSGNYNVLGPLSLHAEATGADPTDDEYLIVNYNPTAFIPTSVPSTVSTAKSARTIIRQAMLNLGAIGRRSDPITGDEMQDGFDGLLNMMDDWGAERLTMFNIESNDHALTASTAAYTLGSGGDFDQARPSFISAISALYTSGGSIIELPIKDFALGRWQRLPLKTTESIIPLYAYIDGGFPLRTVNLWPVPSTSTTSVRIYAPVAVTQFSDLDTLVAFPPGYCSAIEWNLTKRLAPQLGRPLEPDVAEHARTSFARIARVNFSREVMRPDEALSPRPRGWDYRTD